MFIMADFIMVLCHATLVGVLFMLVRRSRGILDAIEEKRRQISAALGEEAEGGAPSSGPALAEAAGDTDGEDDGDGEDDDDDDGEDDDEEEDGDEEKTSVELGAELASLLITLLSEVGEDYIKNMMMSELAYFYSFTTADFRAHRAMIEKNINAVLAYGSDIGDDPEADDSDGDGEPSAAEGLSSGPARVASSYSNRADGNGASPQSDTEAYEVITDADGPRPLHQHVDGAPPPSDPAGAGAGPGLEPDGISETIAPGPAAASPRTRALEELNE